MTTEAEMNLEHGDPFELEHSHWLRSRLPNYEKVWAAFIGYDGLSRPLPIPGLHPDVEVLRQEFYQAHYTMAHRCFSIDQMLKRATETLGKVEDHDELHREFEFLYIFMGAIGHVRDMFVKMDHALSLGGSVGNALQDSYDLRSHVIHGPQMPHVIEAGLLKIPPIATRNKSANEWDDKSLWADMDATNFVFAAEFCEQTGEEFFKLINKMHPKVFDGADRLFKGRRVDWSRRKTSHGMDRRFSMFVQPPLILGSGNVSQAIVIYGTKAK